MNAVKDVFPDATVTPKMRDDYPIRVKIEAELDGKKLLVWEDDQRNLFRKNRARRTKAIETIQANLKILQEGKL